MDKADVAKALTGSVPISPPGPVRAVIVAEDRFNALILAARDVVFEAPDFDNITETLDALDRLSEPFSDLLDPEADEACRTFRAKVARVRLWLDGGCVTWPPVDQIRALVEALS